MDPMKRNRQLNYLYLLIIVVFIITGLLLTACACGDDQKTYTIGVINSTMLD